MPMSAAVRATRIAISPRLAINSFLIGLFMIPPNYERRL